MGVTNLFLRYFLFQFHTIFVDDAWLIVFLPCSEVLTVTGLLFESRCLPSEINKLDGDYSLVTRNSQVLQCQ